MEKRSCFWWKFFASCLFCFCLLGGESEAASLKFLKSIDALGESSSFWMAIKVDLEPGEIIQANAGKNQTFQIELKGAQNIESLGIRWPKPVTKHLYGLTAAVYDRSFVLPVKVNLKNPKQPVTVAGKVTYVVCGTMCEPKEEAFAMSVPQGKLEYSKDNGLVLKAIQHWQTENESSLALILVLAFLGGMILNLMPCVLPVLALKFLSVLASKKMTNPRSGFLMTTVGILLSFWALAALVIFLRKLGTQVGWGMHFQQPAFLAVMIVIMVVFAGNLLGFFEIQLPSAWQRWIDQKIPLRHDKKIWSSFATGVFATALATPCTAPFLGVAIGFALAHEFWVIFLIFTAIALGFAMPYMMLMALPPRFIPHPKPGPWMAWIKRFLAFCLLATSIWLGYVLWQQLQPRLVVTRAHTGVWRPFQPEQIEELIKTQKVVMVNVTASWCLTCHVNANFLERSKELAPLLTHKSVYLMEADWTSADPSITNFLNHYGRSGIPFTIIFGPQEPEGIILPELLTTAKVKDALKQAGFQAER